MKNKLIFIVLVSASFLFSFSVMAKSFGEPYLGIQYAFAEYNEDGISKSFNPTSAILRLGGYVNSNFSIETRVGNGVNDDTQFLTEFGISGLDATLELNRMAGLYAVGHINIAKALSIYGVLGASRLNGITSVPSLVNVTSSGHNSSYSYGAGASIKIIKNVSIDVEYMMYLDKNTFDLSMLAAGVTIYF